MRLALLIVGALCLVASGCSVVSNNRVFPKLTWYWTAEAKEQRASEQRAKDWQRENAIDKKP